MRKEEHKHMMPGVDDPIWQRIREETRSHAQDEPILASYLHATISTTTASSVR
jgi:hypothetical protein